MTLHVEVRPVAVGHRQFRARGQGFERRDGIGGHIGGPLRAGPHTSSASTTTAASRLPSCAGPMARQNSSAGALRLDGALDADRSIDTRKIDVLAGARASRRMRFPAYRSASLHSATPPPDAHPPTLLVRPPGAHSAAPPSAWRAPSAWWARRAAEISDRSARIDSTLACRLCRRAWDRESSSARRAKLVPEGKCALLVTHHSDAQATLDSRLTRGGRLAPAARAPSSRGPRRRAPRFRVLPEKA